MIFTEFQVFPAAEVMSDSVLTVTVDFTKYTTPSLFKRTVALCEFFNVAGVNTAIGGPLSMVTSVAVVIAEGPLLPETSDTAFALTARSSVPSEHIFTVTEIFVPEDEDGV